MEKVICLKVSEKVSILDAYNLAASFGGNYQVPSKEKLTDIMNSEEHGYKFSREDECITTEERKPLDSYDAASIVTLVKGKNGRVYEYHKALTEKSDKIKLCLVKKAM